MDFFQFFNNERTRWVVLGLAAFLLLFAQSSRTRLTADPVFYAAVAKTMADSADFSALRIGDEPYYNKPPLLFWMAALAIKVFGPNALAVTLPSRMFGLGCILLTAWLGSYFYGARVGWAATLILITTHLFFRGSSTFRLDPALTFGILLALYGYFNGEKKWRAVVFYLGVSVGVLAKGPPGLLPLFIVPVHAVLSAEFRSWPKRVIPWLIWSPLLLLPFTWWVHLYMTDGPVPFTVLYNDLLRAKGTIAPKLTGFWAIYVVGFAQSYWPWLPFALAGTWLLGRDALNPKLDRPKRATAGFLLAWVGVVFASCAFKKAQYFRYAFMALPAISVIAANAFVRFAGEKFFARLPGAVALLTLAGAIGLACFPSLGALNEPEQYQAMAEIIRGRLPPKVALPFVKLKPGRNDSDPELSRSEKAAALFYFGRPVQIVSLDEVLEASSGQRVTLLVRTDEISKVSAAVPIEVLIAGGSHVLAEVARR